MRKQGGVRVDVSGRDGIWARRAARAWGAPVVPRQIDGDDVEGTCGEGG